jgi:chemotaxis protein MotB
MARRRRHQEEHLNHEAWAIPYGDLVTLLLAFFVTMYSISTVNSGKYRVLSDSLNAAFNGTPRAPQAIVVIGDDAATINSSLPINQVNRLFSAGMPAQMNMPLPQANGTVRVGQPTPGSADPRDQANRERADYEQALAQRLQQMEADVTGALGALVKDHTVTVRRHGDNLEVQISTDILFGSGAAQLSPRAVSALQSLAAALKPWPNGVRVEGHTDDRPIHTMQFPSNWELSAARAASVVHLFADAGVGPERMSVVGFAEYAPLQPNDSSEGRNANRRVTVTILGRGEKPAGTEIQSQESSNHDSQ